MQIRQAFLLAALSAVSAGALAGCGSKSPSEPPSVLSGTDRFSLGATLVDGSGQKTLGWVQLSIDHVVEADSCSPGALDAVYDSNGNATDYFCTAPSFSSVQLSANDHIAPGSHILRVSILQQSANAYHAYTVNAFSILISDANGKPIKMIQIPAQTATLTAGQELDYSFSV
jgi:hypothetical protein